MLAIKNVKNLLCGLSKMSRQHPDEQPTSKLNSTVPKNKQKLHSLSLKGIFSSAILI